MSRIRVMLIEDDYYARYAFYSLLSKDRRTTVLDEAHNVEEAQWLLEVNGKPVLPDIILVDVDPFGQERDPVELLRGLMDWLRRRKLPCKVVCCLMEPTLPFIRAAVELGVDAILKKEEAAGNIADVVERVHQGFFCYTRSVSERAFGRIQGVQHAACYLVPPRRGMPLNRALQRVARLYCEDNLPAAEIAEILHLSESGVRRQIRRIYQILGVHSREEARQKLRGIE